MTRPTSRTTARAAIVPKVAICETDCAPYFCLPYSCPPPHRVGVERGEPPLQALTRRLHQVVLEADVPGRRKLRQPAFPELEREIAAASDLDGVGERLGQIGEELRHLGLRQEIALRGKGARAALVAEHVPFRDAHPGFVRGEILRPQELHRVR